MAERDHSCAQEPSGAKQRQHSMTEKTRRLKRLNLVMVSLIIMLLALVLSRGTVPNAGSSNVSGFPSPDVDPREAAIRHLLSATQSGDVQRWLNCFTGVARSQSQTRLASTGEKLLSAELRTEGQQLTSYALREWTSQADNSASVILEKLFAERTEIMRVNLQQDRGVWRISEMNPQNESSPEIPYGTPVTP